MIRVVKKLAVIGTVLIPAALMIAVYTNTSSTPEKEVVDKVVNQINALPKVAKPIASEKLPSTITTQKELYENITPPPNNEQLEITATIENANDEKGTLTAKYTIRKDNFSKNTNITYTGFSTTQREVDKVIVNKNIDLINQMIPTVTTKGTQTYPSTITENNLKDYVQYPLLTTPSDNLEIKGVINSFDDIDGILDVTYQVSKNEITRESKPFTYEGFRSTKKEDRQDIQKNINNLKSLSKIANSAGSNLLPSTITNKTELYNNLTEVPKETLGVTISPTFDFKNANDDLGTLTVSYTVTKGVIQSNPVVITYTGFSNNNNEKVKAKKAEIDQIVKGTASLTGQDKLPAEVTNKSLKNDINNYPDEGLGVNKVTITPTITPNDLEGNLSVIYTITKGEKDNITDNPFVSSKSNPIVYEGFVTTTQNDQKIIDNIIDYIDSNQLTGSSKEGSGADQRLPSSIQVSELSKYVFFPPGDATITVQQNNLRPDDTYGELWVKFTVGRNNLVQTSDWHLFTGFLTTNKDDLNKMVNTINNIENPRANPSGTKLLPTEITVQTLRDNVLPPITVQEGMAVEIEGDLKPNDIDGTLGVTYRVYKGGESKLTNQITYQGFLKESDKADQIAVDKNITRIESLSREAKPDTTLSAGKITVENLYDNIVDNPTIGLTDGVTITPQLGVVDDQKRTLTVTYLVTKGSKTKSTQITYSGFAQRSEPVILQTSKLEVIPDWDISLNRVDMTFSQKIDNTHYWIGTSTGVKEVEYDFTTNKATIIGTIPLLDTDMQHTWSQKIDDTHYWVGTDAGIYEVKVDPITKLVTETPHHVDLGWIPNVLRGWSQQIDDTHFWVGTLADGVYEVVVDPITKLITEPPVQNWMIPNVDDGWSQKIDDTHYWIATADDGIYEVEVDPETKLITGTPKPTTKFIDGYEGFSQKIDDTHYLIGTYSEGLYQVTIDPSTKLISGTPTLVDKSLLPVNFSTGWSQAIGAGHYLVGTEHSGVYDLKVDSNGQVIAATPLAQTGTGSDIYIPSVGTGWIQRLNDTHYLVGTKFYGVYQIITS